ncbi:MAG: hypothetical protein RIC19_19610 [Phaeodactylibacter sp.]|uniref:hypothetical protein n=1 Tax=Phaeodactylibacter sp. TaxID=1940289 RepID=UPI0032EB91D1
MQKAIHPALILALALLLASGCRKEDEECYDPTDSSCANYDPCWEKEAVSAGFVMEERVAHFDSVWHIPTDTILEGGILRLRALQPADSIRWQMSGDPRTWDSEELRMQFGGSESLEISLTLWREPDTLCFPDDDGIDSLTRRLTVVPHPEAAIIGRYRGATDANPDEPYELEIFWRESTPSASHATIQITGIHPGCNNTFDFNVITSVGSGYLAYAFWRGSLETTTGCSAPQGIARLSANRQEITVRFRMRNLENVSEFLPETTFRGVRL